MFSINFVPNDASLPTVDVYFHASNVQVFENKRSKGNKNEKGEKTEKSLLRTVVHRDSVANTAADRICFKDFYIRKRLVWKIYSVVI